MSGPTCAACTNVAYSSFEPVFVIEPRRCISPLCCTEITPLSQGDRQPFRCFLATSTPSGNLRGVPAIAFAMLFAFLLLPGAQAVTTDAAADRDVSGWSGRCCTPADCAGIPSSPVAQAAGFGVASLAILLLARRRGA